jgi:hypothetical protein
MQAALSMSLTTPALLFPAISLLLLAYTNRFLTLAQVIRTLHSAAAADPHGGRARQVQVLRRRLGLIKHMQLLGGASFLVCTLSMFALFVGYPMVGALLLGVALLALCASLVCSLLEVLMSTDAIEIEIADLEFDTAPRRRDVGDGTADGSFP